MDSKLNLILRLKLINLLIIIVLLFINLSKCQNYTSINNQKHLYSSNPYNYGKSRTVVGCDTTVTRIEGSIYSPNFPLNYDNYVQCVYHIVKASQDVCNIEVILNDFDVEDTPECTADYLDLGDGKGRLCGILNANTRKVVWFPANGDNINILFKSNHMHTSKGFVAKIRQLRNSCPPYVMPNIVTNKMQTSASEPKPEVFHRQPVYLGSYCDIYIGEVIGDLRSPGYPYGYHNNQSCHYSIRRAASDICKVELIFQHFDIASYDRRFCDSDFVELPDRSRLCGKIPLQQRVYPFSRSSDYVILKFISDHIVDKHTTGFWIEIRQLRNSCDQKTPQNAIKCDQTISGQNTIVHSTNYPQFYGPSQQCVYLVEPSDKNTCEYEIQFLNFNIESSRDYLGNCNKDFLQYPDGSRICGFSSAKKTFSFPKYRDRIGMFYFSSDDNHEERGYELRVNQIPNSCFNNHNYGFTIKPSYITSTPAPPYLTTSYYPTNVMSNNTYQSSYNTTYYTCDQIIGSEITVITSPNYPREYPVVSRCIYTFIKSMPSVCQIRIKILDMDLEHSRDCANDYLLIESTGQRFCGQFMKTEDKIINYPSFSRELRLIFNSDRQTTRPGFRLRAEQIPNSCTHPVIDRRVGDTVSGRPVVEQIPIAGIDPIVVGKPQVDRPIVMQTPPPPPYLTHNTIKPSTQICSSSSTIVSTLLSDNYPLPYNAYTNCVYKVFRASRHVCRLEVTFDDFDVGVEDMDHKYCSNGYVEFDGIKYCGRRKGERVIVDFGSDKQEFNIRFHSESAVRYGGFKIQVRQMDHNCGHQNSVLHEFSPGSTESCGKMSFSEKALQILSPHYETGSYQPFLDCQYTIQKAVSDICALEVKFDAFALEESKNCQKDYLQIGSMRLCGKLPYAATRTYEFKGEEIPITFHTDANEQAAGFMIMVKQIQC